MGDSYHDDDDDNSDDDSGDDDDDDDECDDDKVFSSFWEFAQGSLLFTLSPSSCPGAASHHYSNALIDDYFLDNVQQSFSHKIIRFPKINLFHHKSLAKFRTIIELIVFRGNLLDYLRQANRWAFHVII